MGERKFSGKSYIKYSFPIFLGLFILSFLILYFLEFEIRKAKVEELEANELRVVEMESDFLDRDFTMLLGDLHYLRHAFEEDLNAQKNIELITDQWIDFSFEKKIYDQIRYFDVDGNEIIRVNYENKGSYSVSENKLQNKADRYYFQESLKLSQNDVYISPLDLNVENGEVEVPHKPMIRMSVALKDSDNKTRGIIVVNYLAKRTLNSFRIFGENSRGEILLVNDKGYSLSSSDSSKDWNFMFEERESESFSSGFAKAWDNIVSGKAQFVTTEGLFTVKSSDFSKSLSDVNPDSSINSSDKWYVVSYIERNKENSHLFNDNYFKLAQEVLVKNALYFLLIIVVSGLVGFMVFLNRVAYSKIKFHSEYDSLTKTYNRRAGMEKINKILTAEDRRSSLMNLCFIDINGLKDVNDNLGHKFGDELIITVANIIKGTIRESDFLVRLGGDEFLIVFCGIDLNASENVWQRIVDEFNNVNENEKRSYIISVSHGIVDYDKSHINQLDSLLSEADQKMYAEKEIIKKGLKIIRE